MKTNTKMWKKVAAVDLLLLCFSLTVSLTGQMFRAIKQTYSLSLTQGSLLLSIQSIGGIIFSVICILIIDAFNRAKTLIIMGFALCGLMIAIGAIPPLFALFAMFAVLGFSGAAVNTLTNAVLIETVPDKTGRHISILHFMFSLGALTAPIASQALFTAFGLSAVFLFFGGFAFCCTVYAAAAFSDRMRQKLMSGSLSLKRRMKETWAVIKIPGMKQVFLIAVFVCAWQLSAIYFISSYFTEISSQPMDGAFALSLLFLGMMLSRLVYARIADRFSQGRVLMLTNIAGLLAWVCIFLVPGISEKMIFLGLAAVLCGNNTPIMYVIACMTAPKNAAAASGIATLGYYIALLTFLPFIGSLGDAFGLENVLIFCAAPLLLAIPAAYAFHRKVYANKYN